MINIGVMLSGVFYFFILISVIRQMGRRCTSFAYNIYGGGNEKMVSHMQFIQCCRTITKKLEPVPPPTMN